MDHRRSEKELGSSRHKNHLALYAIVAVALMGAMAAGLFLTHDLARAGEEPSGAAGVPCVSPAILQGGQRIAVKLAPGARLIENPDGTLTVGQDWATLTAASAGVSGLPLKQTNQLEALGVRVLEPVSAASFSIGGLVAASSPCNVDLNEAVGALRLMPGVLWAEVSQPIYACLVPDDPYYSSGTHSSTGQWGLSRVGFEEAWDITTGSAGVTIAVLDTGLNKSISDFSGRIVSPYSVLAEDTDWPAWQDKHGHGTGVAGVVAARGNDTDGMAGAAWNVMLMPVKISEDGTSTDLTLAAGIEYAVDHGADVINVSFASPPGAGYSHALAAAVNYAYGRGVLIVAAAGNDGGEIGYPAAFESVIAVGATESSDSRWARSNTGPSLDIAAPGNQIISYGLSSTEPKYSWSGTSVAAPLVTGAVALMMSVDSSLTPGQITDIITDSADDLGDSGWDQEFGWGLLDAYKAVSEAEGGGATTTTTEASTTTTTGVSTTTTTGVSTTTTTGMPSTTTTTENTFADVSEGSTPYWKEIDYLASLGVVSGSKDGLFHPEDALMRQQFAKIIVLALGYPVTGTEVCPFGDLAARIGIDPFYPYYYVAVAYQQGIAKGTNPTHFSPYRSLTRSQMISMVARAANLSEPPAGYTPPFPTFSTVHYPYARRAAYAGLLNGLVGMGPGYDFTAPASRGEVCALLYALLQ
jgi:subtilisin family serine protease